MACWSACFKVCLNHMPLNQSDLRIFDFSKVLIIVLVSPSLLSWIHHLSSCLSTLLWFSFSCPLTPLWSSLSPSYQHPWNLLCCHNPQLACHLMYIHILYIDTLLIRRKGGIWGWRRVMLNGQKCETWIDVLIKKTLWLTQIACQVTSVQLRDRQLIAPSTVSAAHTVLPWPSSHIYILPLFSVDKYPS